MSLDRLRYELRLLGKGVWLTPILVISGLTLLLTIASRGISVVTVARSLGASLEILLPVAAGVVIATVATHDRAIELQLTMPRHYHRTANIRVLLILLWCAVVCLLTGFSLSLFNRWRLPTLIADWAEPWRFLTWQLTWLSPMLWLVAVGLVLSLLIRSRTASGALICVLACGEIIGHDALNQNLWYHPFYLFPLTFSPAANYWLTSRYELLATAAVLLLLAWFLLHQPGLLLERAPGEE